MATENQKIPCGGFRIGDGLTMDGDTLKSLGGAFVKIGVDKMPSSASEQVSYSFLDDSPIQNFIDLLSMSKIMPITLYIYLRHDSVLTLVNVSNLFASNPNSAQFERVAVLQPNLLTHDVLSIFLDKMSLLEENYTLTPAT